MTAARLEEMRLDAEELKSLLSSATRQKVKDLLSLDIRKVETDIIRLQEQLSKETEQNKASSSAPTPVTSTGGRCYDVKIMNYAWDQSDKFVKIFVTLKNVHTIPAENVSCDFKDRSMELHVNGLENRNHHLPILNLLEEIDVEKSYWKVKTDNVIVFMAKSKIGEKWSHITGVEKKVTEKKTPKYEPSDDPSSSIMGLLKQMYEDGDDEMKRTIAKAWSSNQDKKSTLDDMPSMPSF
ncbi:Calcyclin-binding protein [Frankliniella fusca]|uniref:Calcyclin-binding protein n=1 Tax=Frankliniella fusca TaxID=407009 RepID=A0AAE1GR83_9NEOP|nr:Calcyclin-binding protein [Frankliniella fusca]